MLEARRESVVEGICLLLQVSFQVTDFHCFTKTPSATVLLSRIFFLFLVAGRVRDML
jgi:hypothetical protein